MNLSITELVRSRLPWLAQSRLFNVLFASKRHLMAQEAAARQEVFELQKTRDEERQKHAHELNKLITDVQRLSNFGGHYFQWRFVRIRAIVERFGASWFKDKRILELGCGYGDIGIAFSALGADVTFSDARDEHLRELRNRYPNLPEEKIIRLDLENGIPGDRRYDMIIHMGVLYHLDNWQRTLLESAQICDFMVLETEVSDSNAEGFELKRAEAGADQAFGGQGTRPSEAYIESVLTDAGFDFERVKDARCNSTFHIYDWQVANTETWRHGLRRFWFCERKSH